MVVVDVLEFLVLLLIICNTSSLGVATVDDDECSVTRCHHRGSQIRFPFRRNYWNEDPYGYPAGFGLSCQSDYTDKYSDYPVVEFEYQVNTSSPGLYPSFSVKAYVHCINYKSRQLYFIYSSNTIRQHYGQNVSPSPFKPFTSNKYQLDYTQNLTDYTFYNCSSSLFELQNVIEHVPYYPFDDHYVYAVYSYLRTTEAILTSCTKLYNISDVPFLAGGLSWSGPDCGDCEAKRKYCKFKANSTTLTECFPIPKGPSSTKLLVSGVVGGIFFLLAILVAVCYAIYLYKQNKNYQQRIEMFLEDYKALKPTRYSYADIKKISNHFKIKLGEGGYGSVFKGQLSNDFPVAVKILNDKVDAKGSGQDFINEVSTIGSIHHVNVVRLVGYCADGCRRALVYEFLPNNSLEKFVRSRENRGNGFLGWEKMEEIALGIAKGIEYLHQGCAQRILHFDIKPHNILLDQNFNPKISDFGLAKLCTKGQSIVSMTMARGTVGYIAPEVYSRNFGKVSSKSDVYSFGMLLLEMVGARSHCSIAAENTSEVYFPEWIFHQLEKGKETRSQIEEEVNSQIERKLTVVGLWCVNWHPADRPSMKHVIQMLEGEDCPAIPPNPFSSTSSRNAFAPGSARPFANELEVISESE